MPPLPLDPDALHALTERYPTPFYLYDEAGIRASARALHAAFAWAPGFRNYFAVKALPNPHILKILASEGLGADCSSLPELLLAEIAGMRGDALVLTSNDTPAEEYAAAHRLGALINLDDIGHLGYLARHVGVPERLSFRYNPGPLGQGNAIIGVPEQSKFGVTRAQLLQGYRAAWECGVRRFGLHTMVASNELDLTALVGTARLLIDLAAELTEELGFGFELLNFGGGIGIPYRPEQQPVDLIAYGAQVRALLTRFTAAGLPVPRLALECGRVVTGPHGWLVSHVRHVKTTYKTFVGLDASMANLMRPGMYGAYHHVSVPGRDSLPPDTLCDLTGSLCENNDKFAVDRWLPALVPGDLVAVHDAGAHGHAMGFNYNGKLRCAELLLRADGSVVQIRRAETVADYFATLTEPVAGS